eukprot:CAMPEP_0175261756 /NCGR_PEP_ID=MMETSP0093-20121207/40923_1 /TAXON_ID=311494 /ORGANISM="Alexandrium monilatum, Strain CCMP3105" /LENGTH=54 /DNA_ID=CAMNT_0016556223 /DNA_START=22 /DNA_END=186 /DNA_ORIENTATION=-
MKPWMCDPRACPRWARARVGVKVRLAQPISADNEKTRGRNTPGLDRTAASSPGH